MALENTNIHTARFEGRDFEQEYLDRIKEELEMIKGEKQPLSDEQIERAKESWSAIVEIPKQ